MIEVFADVCCPFTHVGLRRLVAVRDERGIDSVLHVRAWPLELVNGAPLNPAFIAEEVEALRDQVAPDLFTGFDPSRFPATSIPALALTNAAYEAGPAIGERVALALRNALFEDGRDIAAADVLLDIAEGAGIGLPDHGGRECVLEDWHEGQQRGVVGSPHFFVGGASYFCPTLQITRIDGELHISDDRAAFTAFVHEALGL